jgi:antiviral helicase SKI2
MDAARHHELIQQILFPDAVDKDKILNDLGLDGLPSREQVHREIEEKLLLPQETLPLHWLPSYQVYDCIPVLSP